MYMLVIHARSLSRGTRYMRSCIAFCLFLLWTGTAVAAGSPIEFSFEIKSPGLIGAQRLEPGRYLVVVSMGIFGGCSAELSDLSAKRNSKLSADIGCFWQVVSDTKASVSVLETKDTFLVVFETPDYSREEKLLVTLPIQRVWQ